MDISERILGELKLKGYRRSAARPAVIGALAAADAPLSVPDLERLIASASRRFNKTTVYREIELLKREGYVAELALRNDVALYELVGPHHHHLVCVGCGVVRDVEVQEEAFGHVTRRLERKEGFRIFDHSLEFFGQCAKCR